jgi:hypothetical protein
MLLFRRSRSHNLKNSSKPRVMGSFLSCLAKPPPAGDDPNSAVVTWDEQWTAHKSAGKLVSAEPPASLPLSLLCTGWI